MKGIVSLWWKDICWRAVFTFCIPQEILKAKFMQQYWEGADRQGVLGNAKITKSKEGASSSTSKVNEDLVRSFCLFSVMAPLFTFSRIRGKLIWFLVQLFNTSSDFLEWKKRLIHEEANIFIILLSWSSLKREHVLFSMIEGKLPRHMTWRALFLY